MEYLKNNINFDPKQNDYWKKYNFTDSRIRLCMQFYKIAVHFVRFGERITKIWRKILKWIKINILPRWNENNPVKKNILISDSI